MSDYKYIQLNDHNYDYTRILYNQAFGINRSVSQIKKKYDTGMFGFKNIGFFALADNDTPAAFYGVFPIVMTINNKDYSVAQSGDTMTAPDHRGKGLFIKLAERTYKLSEEQGIKLIFGFPNENSFPGFQKKLKWQFHGNMQKFSFKNLGLPLSELSSKFNFLKTGYEKYCNLRLSKYKIALTEENISHFNHSKSTGYIKKDLNFFNYKLNDPNNYLLKINGFYLLIKPVTHLIVGDIGYFSKEKVPNFLKTIKKMASILACRDAIIIVSKNHWLYELLKDIKPSTENLPIGFLPFSEIDNLHDISFTQADYDTF